MNHTRKNLTLYLSNREQALGVPLYILAVVVLISVAIALIAGIRFGLPVPQEFSEGMSGNIGGITAVPGFLVYLGVVSLNHNFSMALAFGSTRRHLWTGTSLGFLITSAVTAAGSLVFLALEHLTNYWFIGARAFDVAVLGDGNYLVCACVVFVMSLLSLFVGALFGTVYRAFGPRWTTVVGIAVGLVVLLAVAVLVWRWGVIAPALADLGIWAAVIAGAVAAALAAGGSYTANRYATV